MPSARSVVLAAPVRTAIGTFGGSLKDVAAVDLGGAAIAAAVARAGLRPDEIGTVVMGNVIQAGSKMNPGRQASIRGGLPVTVPALTVNRVCGSGAQAIVSSAHEIFAGAVDAAVAGGMENMDLAPYLIARGRWGYRMGDGQMYDSVLRDGSTTPSRIRRRGGTPRIWCASSRSAARRKMPGRCARSSASAPPRRPGNSRMRSSRWRCPVARARRGSTATSITGPTRRSKRWRR